MTHAPGRTSTNYVSDELFYGGRWNTASAGAGAIEVVSASTEEVLGSVPDPLEADIDAAVAAARGAFDDPTGWSRWPVDRRADAMEQLAAILESHAGEFARLVSAQNGKPITL